MKSMLQNKNFKLKGKVQHYAWGGYEFIPTWLGIQNKERKPFAEYWMGAHPLSPSEVVTPNGDFSLALLIKDNAEKFLGEPVVKKFGELPFLFKVLDVREMLSIQVHPSKKEAEKGFAAEEAAGIPANSPTRNYKDKNHKPEVMVALSEFWLLHGFLKEDELKDVLHGIPEFKELEQLFENDGYKGLYSHVMHLPQEEINKLLQPLVQREMQRKKNKALTKDQPGWWVTKFYEHADATNIDRGIFSIYFFNIVRVNPGEAVFQGAGIPHAYLEGQTMELMANSDNVLRGGLTPKHIDIPELLKHTKFEGVTPNVMKGEEKPNGERNYPCPVEDFAISKIELKSSQTYGSVASSLEIIAVMEGELDISGINKLTAKKGEVMAILCGEMYKISTSSRLLAYKAFVP
jgi:mannose-6-phosphate isomerase